MRHIQLSRARHPCYSLPFGCTSRPEDHASQHRTGSMIIKTLEADSSTKDQDLSVEKQA